MVRVKKIRQRSFIRHSILHRSALQGITKASILRLARRGGVKRISSPVFDETRDVLKQFLGGVLNHATVYCDHGKKKTITASDIVRAFKSQGRTVFGYGK